MINKENTDILIFKTNLRYKKDLKKIDARMTEEPRIQMWHIDIEDIDKVLRIESSNIAAKEVIEMVALAGYQCEELPD